MAKLSILFIKEKACHIIVFYLTKYCVMFLLDRFQLCHASPKYEFCVRNHKELDGSY